METIDGVIYLAKCAVTEQIPYREIVDSLDLDAVYRESSRHMIAAMVGMALKDAGVENERFQQAIAASQRKTIIQEVEKRKVIQKLDEAGIWHMALKGSVIKDWYPRFGMRESADVDILFDKEREEDVREIMIELGFSVKSYGSGHSDNYYKKPLCNFEMHPNLFGPGHRDIDNKYYENIKEKLVQTSGYKFEFTLEDFYIFFLAHEYKHYTLAGMGLRFLFDTYIILQKNDLNWDYVSAELEKLDILDFEKKYRTLVIDLLSDKKIDEEEEYVLEYIIESGTFGLLKNKVRNEIKRHGGKFQYIYHRLFLPKDVVRREFPIIYKSKVLIPFLPLYRLVKGINNGHVKREAKILFSVNNKSSRF